MSNTAATAQRQQNTRQGLLARLIGLPFQLFGVLVGSLLLSIIVECAGMHLIWKDQGWHHAQAMLHYELGHLSNHFTRSVIVQEPGHTAHQLVDTGYDWIFVKTGLLARMEQARASSQSAKRGFRYFIGQAYTWAENYLIAAAFITLTFGVRLLILILILPLILTAGRVNRWPCPPRRAPLWCGTRIRLCLPPRQSQFITVGGVAMGGVFSIAGVGASAGHSVAKRGVIGTGSQPDSGEFQKIPLVGKICVCTQRIGSDLHQLL